MSNLNLMTDTECERRIAEARAEEREACAKIADDSQVHYQDEPCSLTMMVALRCIAAAIRSRGGKP